MKYLAVGTGRGRNATRTGPAPKNHKREVVISSWHTHAGAASATKCSVISCVMTRRHTLLPTSRYPMAVGGFLYKDYMELTKPLSLEEFIACLNEIVRPYLAR